MKNTIFKLFFLLFLANILNASYVVKPRIMQEFNQDLDINLAFDDLKANVFKYVFKDAENIKISKKSDLILPTFVNGINLVWLLPDEFMDFLDEDGLIFALPKRVLSGELSVILKLQKNGKIIKEEAITSPFNLKIIKK